MAPGSVDLVGVYRQEMWQNALAPLMRAACISCNPRLRRKCGYSAIRQAFVAEIGHSYSACFLNLNESLRDELLDPIQPGLKALNIRVSVLAPCLKHAPAPHL